MKDETKFIVRISCLIILLSLLLVCVFCIICYSNLNKTNFCTSNGYEGSNSYSEDNRGYCWNISNHSVIKRYFQSCPNSEEYCWGGAEVGG